MYFRLIIFTILISINDAKDCLRCICEIESGCKPIGCRTSFASLRCGYYQINLTYYIDCGMPGKKPSDNAERAWKKCSQNYSCATKCVENYVGKFSRSCEEIDSCECTARIHKRGASAIWQSYTVGYWNRVKTCCNCT